MAVFHIVFMHTLFTLITCWRYKSMQMTAKTYITKELKNGTATALRRCTRGSKLTYSTFSGPQIKSKQEPN